MRLYLFLASTLALAALIGGCGKVSNFPDASGGGDDTIDASTTDAMGRGTVNVTVLTNTGDGLPFQGASVVFLDPDGSLVTRATTPADGKVSADVLPGGSVTVIRLFANRNELATILAVKPGDDLQFGVRGAPIVPLNNQTMTVNFTPYPGGVNHSIQSNCLYGSAADGIASVVVNLYDCPGDTHDIVAYATAPSGKPVFAHADAQTLGNGGTLIIPNNWAPTRLMAVNFTNIPNNIEAPYVEYRQWSGTDNYSMYSNGNSITMNGATGALEMDIGPNFWEADLLTNVRRTQGTFQSQRLLAHSIGTNFGLDLGATLLPWITEPSVDGATATMAWALDGPGEYDGIFAEVNWSHMTSPDLYTYYDWTIVAPPGLTSLKLPTLPAEAGGALPTAADSPGGRVGIVDLDAANYDELRPTAILDQHPLSGYYTYLPFTTMRVSGWPPTRKGLTH